MNDWDYRVDIFLRAIPRREDNPDSWPRVRVIHIPTGIVVDDRSTPSEHQNKEAAIAECERRIAAAGVSSGTEHKENQQ